MGYTISKDSLQKYSVFRLHFAIFFLHKYKRKGLGNTEFTLAIVVNLAKECVETKTN